jgi:Helicase associated domain
MEYWKVHGHANVPHNYNDDQTPHLGRWVQHQRRSHKNYLRTKGKAGAITRERMQKLDNIGFQWEFGRRPQHDMAWMTMFHQLKTFNEKYNTAKIAYATSGCSAKFATISRWATKQRDFYKLEKPDTLGTTVARHMK